VSGRLFFDTTSTYFETEVADESLWRDAKGRPVPTDPADQAVPAAFGDTDVDDPALEPPVGAVKQTGFRVHGKSKDHRDDLPQVVIGMAVTRDGIPVRVWCWPATPPTRR